MTYQNVIVVGYDPGVQNLYSIRGITFSQVLEADFVVIRRSRFYLKSSLEVFRMSIEKDRYANNTRVLTREELESILAGAEQVTRVQK